MAPCTIPMGMVLISKKKARKDKMEEMLYTVKEVAKIIKTNPNYVYELIKAGYLPALKLGSCKVRRTSLINFLEKYDGKDLTDLNNIKDFEFTE